jgi:Uma2 family endonuclease
MSPTDNLSDAQTKMIEYQQNGVKMGWLINRRLQQVEVYQLGKERPVLTKPTNLCGDSILVNFRLNLTDFW